MTIEIKKGKNLSKKDSDLMNYYRRKEYSSYKTEDFKKEDPNSDFFFVKDSGKIVAFGMLKPVNVEYLGKKYNILGIGKGMAIEKGKGYGKIMMAARIKYLKKTGKTGLGFTLRKNLGFYEKSGLKTSKNFIKRFRYRNPITGKIVKDNVGDGIYYEGKDKLISKILSTKSIAYISVPFW